MPNNLAALRTKCGLSQSQLAEAVGVTTLTLGRWERGEALPRKFNFKALCKIFQCTEEELAFPSLSPAAPFYDPVIDPIIPLTHIELIGRETDLARIKAQLLGQGNGYVGLCALNGIPGVGKTSLAIAIAHDVEIRASLKDGVLWAAIGPTPNIPGLLSRWAGLLGLPEATFSRLDPDQKRQQLRRALATRAMLLVLDDVWRLEDAHALYVGGSQCACLLTTRFPLIASGMARKNVLLIEELDTERSLRLLRTLAPEVVGYAPERVRTLVQDLGGLPLALTLLGNYLRQQSYKVSARRAVSALNFLNDPQTRLQISEPHVQAEAHPSIPISTPISLQFIIAVSDEHLTPSAREILYALSVFPPKPESFSEEAALMIAASTVDVLDELDELVDAGLLECHGTRYRLHRIIADYARLQVGHQAAQQLTQRLIAYMQQYVESHAREYELLERETPLLLYALDRAVTSEALQAQFVPLVCVSAPILLMRGYYREIERFLDHAYQVACASQDATAIARVLLYLGELDEKRGNVSRAKERYSLARQTVDHHAPLQGTLLQHIGNLIWKAGDYQEAEALLLEGLAFARQTEQSELVCVICRTLAALLSEYGDRERAESYAREGLAIAHMLQDRQETVALMINLGCCLDTAEKVPIYREALQIAREIKCPQLCCLLLMNIGSWYVENDECLHAGPYLREGLLIAREIGDRQRTCLALLMLTSVLRENEKYAEAKIYLQEGAMLAEELAVPRYICIARDMEGNLALAQHQADAALLAFEEMQRLAPQGDVELEALACYGMARCYEQMGQRDPAGSFGERAWALIQDQRLAPCEERIQAWYIRFLQPVIPTESLTCVCGKTFVRPSGPGRTKLYCSIRCANRARKRIERQRKKGITDNA